MSLRVRLVDGKSIFLIFDSPEEMQDVATLLKQRATSWSKES